jgi:hypothetical protein
MTLHPRWTRTVWPAVLALVSIAVVTRAQTPQRADAAFLLEAYDTYTTMRKASPTQAVNWSYLVRWEVLGGNLPSVQVSDLQISARDNVLVTSPYGRGMWVFDASVAAAK